MTDEPPIVAVLGPTLSSELTVVGQITPVYNVLHVSCDLGLKMTPGIFILIPYDCWAHPSSFSLVPRSAIPAHLYIF